MWPSYTNNDNSNNGIAVKRGEMNRVRYRSITRTRVCKPRWKAQRSCQMFARGTLFSVCVFLTSRLSWFSFSLSEPYTPLGCCVCFAVGTRPVRNTSSARVQWLSLRVPGGITCPFHSGCCCFSDFILIVLCVLLLSAASCLVRSRVGCKWPVVKPKHLNSVWHMKGA